MTEQNTNTNSQDKIYFAWYSDKQKESCGKYFVYLNQDNKEVYATEVSVNDTPPIFDDVVSLGKVIKWVRTEKHYGGRMRMRIKSDSR